MADPVLRPFEVTVLIRGEDDEHAWRLAHRMLLSGYCDDIINIEENPEYGGNTLAPPVVS